MTAVAVLDLVTAAWCLVLTAAGAGMFFEGKDAAVDLGITAFFAVLAYALTLAGVGLLRLDPLGRRVQVGLALASLPLLPVGTLVGGLMLGWFLRPGAGALFHATRSRSQGEQAREVASATGPLKAASALAAATQVAIIALAATMGDNSAGPAPARDEPAAVGELRALVAAERAFADLADGSYADLGCLVQPWECLAGFPSSAPGFVPEALARADARHGYRFSFHPEPPLPGAGASDGARRGLDSYAVMALPTTADGGSRWLCADARGHVCAGVGRPPQPLGGRCPSACATVP